MNSDRPLLAVLLGLVLLCAAMSVRAAAPFNDDIINASSLGSNHWILQGGTIVDATLETSEYVPIPQMQATVWFRWVAPTNDYFQFDTLQNLPPDLEELRVPGLDTVLAVYGYFPASAANLVAFNDDSPGNGGASAVIVPATAGQTYWIQLGGYLLNRGRYLMVLSQALPPNDNYAQSITLPSFLEIHTNGWSQRATAQTNEHTPGNAATVWYRWTAPYSGTYAVDTEGPGVFDTVLAVYRAPSNPLATVPVFADLIASNDDSFPSRASRVRFVAVAGQTYAFQVSGFDVVHQGIFPLNLLPLPQIGLTDPDGFTLTNGSVVTAYTVAGTPLSMNFSVFNTGIGSLSNMNLSLSGTNAAEFAVAVPPPTNVVPNTFGNFSITFAPAVNESFRTATLTLTSNDADQSPFVVTLHGFALGYATDTDGDGFSDAGEFRLRALGFDHQVAQPALVSALMAGAGGVGLFTTNQIQVLNIGAPLIQRDPATGQMTLTIGLKKSTNLVSYPPFPFVLTNTTVNGAGELEFRFAAPENAAFFRLESR